MTRTPHCQCSSRSAVTVIGLLVALGLFIGFLCGLLWVGSKLLDAGRTIEARREQQLTNTADKFALTRDHHDPVVEALLRLPAETLAPAQEVMTDDQFMAWTRTVESWAVLRTETLDDWVDSGNRLTGSQEDAERFLWQLVVAESAFAPIASVAAKDGRDHTQAFYRICRTNEVPVIEQHEDK